ncbi:MAG: transcriptional regulator [Xanthobacteraceae bacterium]|nr:transcriptional regulator [Xanthobacteraceae bacterium]
MQSFSISKFCERQSIGRTLYYELRKRGKTPRTFRVGSVERISEEAEREWVKAREAESEAAA